ncbi:MAG: hypothetical protein IH621_01485 [Krumholzibacteria bacterium]|nr:hypothetical protein [Candidatus Krumholzibacteria bacterium]
MEIIPDQIFDMSITRSTMSVGNGLELIRYDVAVNAVQVVRQLHHYRLAIGFDHSLLTYSGFTPNVTIFECESTSPSGAGDPVFGDTSFQLFQDFINATQTMLYDAPSADISVQPGNIGVGVYSMHHDPRIGDSTFFPWTCTGGILTLHFESSTAVSEGSEIAPSFTWATQASDVNRCIYTGYADSTTTALTIDGASATYLVSP